MRLKGQVVFRQDLRACPQTSHLSPSRFDRSQDPLVPSTHDPASTSGHPTLRTRPRAVPEGEQPHEGGGRVLRRPPQPPMWSPLGRKRDLGAGGFVDTLLATGRFGELDPNSVFINPEDMRLSPTRHIRATPWVALVHLKKTLNQKTACSTGEIKDQVIPFYLHELDRRLDDGPWCKVLPLFLFEGGAP